MTRREKSSRPFLRRLGVRNKKAHLFFSFCSILNMSANSAYICHLIIISNRPSFENERNPGEKCTGTVWNCHNPHHHRHYLGTCFRVFQLLSSSFHLGVPDRHAMDPFVHPKAFRYLAAAFRNFPYEFHCPGRCRSFRAYHSHIHQRIHPSAV